AALVEEGEERVHALEVLLRAAAAEVRAHLEVLEHRHRREQAPVLGHDRHPASDPVARRPARHVLAAEDDAPRARPDDAEDRLQRRRLARRVAAEEADELAGPDLEPEVLEDVDRPVEGVDGVEPEQRPAAVRRRVGHFVSAVRRPRYASTTRGFVATCSNEPSAILMPWSSATTRSETPSTTCMSCSMTRIV